MQELVIPITPHTEVNKDELPELNKDELKNL